MNGCGSTSADNVPQATPAQGNNAQQGEQTAAQELMEVISKADNMAFTLEVKFRYAENGYYDYKENERYTQKNGNIRVDAYPGSRSYSIYDSQKKQIVSIGYKNDGNGELVSTGWQRADTSYDARNNVINGALGQILGVVYFPSERTWTAIGSKYIVNVKKENEGFSFDRTNGGEGTYFLECDGPDGLPSKLVKKVVAYGANPGKDTTYIEFKYSNVNQVPDDLFEVPNNVQIISNSYNTSLNSLCPKWNKFLGDFCVSY